MPSALSAVTKMIEEIETEDTVVKSRCQLALQLATKLDEAISDGSAQSFGASAQLSKELRAVIDELSSVETKKTAFVSSIFDGPSAA